MDPLEADNQLVLSFFRSLNVVVESKKGSEDVDGRRWRRTLSLWGGKRSTAAIVVVSCSSGRRRCVQKSKCDSHYSIFIKDIFGKLFSFFPPLFSILISILSTFVHRRIKSSNSKKYFKNKKKLCPLRASPVTYSFVFFPRHQQSHLTIMFSR